MNSYGQSGALATVDSWRISDGSTKPLYSPSKLQFQCKLDRSGTTNLIEGTETSAALVLVFQASSQHLDGLSKLGDIADVGDGRSEIRVVQEVEDFGAELQFDGFVKRELAMYSTVPLCRAEGAQSISTQVTLLQRSARGWIDRRWDERGRVKSHGPGVL